MFYAIIMIYINITNFVLISCFEKDQSMIEMYPNNFKVIFCNFQIPNNLITKEALLTAFQTFFWSNTLLSWCKS